LVALRATKNVPHPHLAVYSYIYMTPKELKDPSFLTHHQSIASLVGQLHEYFKNACSQHEIERSHASSQLHANQEDQQAQELIAALRKMDAKISLFAVVGDALSIANRVLHSPSTVAELGSDNEIYRMHYDVAQPHSDPQDSAQPHSDQ
jgi:hypothetical protein